MLFAIVLAALLAVPALPVSDADDSEITVSSPADLIALTKLVNGGDSLAGRTVILTADLDMIGCDVLPIGLARYAFEIDDVVAGDPVFRGTFNGCGHTISNFDIDLGTAYADCGGGLFGTAVDASILDLTLQNCTVSGRSDLGLLIGTAKNTSINNVHAVGGSVNSTGTASFCVGGLVGWYYTLLHDTTATHCSSSAAVNVYAATLSQYTGGLFGAFECRADSGDLHLSVGWATGAVTATAGTGVGGVGGLIGIGIADSGNHVTIADCYTTGVLQASAPTVTDVGGLVGSFRIQSLASSEIVSAYYAGTIKCRNAGGIYGCCENDAGNPLLLDSCRYDLGLFAGKVAAEETDYIDAFGLSTAMMQSTTLADTLNSYDGAWTQTAGSYPVLSVGTATTDNTGVLLFSLTVGTAIILCWALVLTRLLKNKEAV